MGQLVSTSGLWSASDSVRVGLRRARELSVVDGSFIGTNGVIGGYAIIEAAVEMEAVDLTRRIL